MTDHQHPAPCPGPQAHVTHTGAVSCMGHAKHTNADRQAAGLQPGMPCRRPPSPGADVCVKHGAGAPHVRDAAARRVLARKVQADATAALAHEGIERVDDPLEQIAILAREAIAFKDALAARVNALHGIRFTDDKGGEQLRSEVALYERAMDRTVRFLDVLVKSNFEERRLARDERLLAQVEQLLRAALDHVGLTREQWERVPGAFEQGLRAIEGGKG